MYRLPPKQPIDDNNALNNEITTPRISINIYDAAVWVLGGVDHRIPPPGCRTSTISHPSMHDDDLSWVLVPSMIDLRCRWSSVIIIIRYIKIVVDLAHVKKA